MNAEQAALLRAPFPPEVIGKLPRATSKDNPKGRCNECGGYHGLPAVHIDYVGHAGVTDRLLKVDPEWTWEPMAIGPNGEPLLTNGGLWIKMTVAGVTRPGFGDESNGRGMKEMIGDAIRNGAMRFGVALDLWSKQDLHAAERDAQRDEELDTLTSELVSGAALVDVDIDNLRRKIASHRMRHTSMDHEAWLRKSIAAAAKLAEEKVAEDSAGEPQADLPVSQPDPAVEAESPADDDPGDPYIGQTTATSQFGEVTWAPFDESTTTMITPPPSDEATVDRQPATGGPTTAQRDVPAEPAEKTYPTGDFKEHALPWLLDRGARDHLLRVGEYDPEALYARWDTHEKDGNAARNLVAACEDTTILYLWADREARTRARKTVLEAIARRLEKLTGMGMPWEESVPSPQDILTEAEEMVDAGEAEWVEPLPEVLQRDDPLQRLRALLAFVDANPTSVPNPKAWTEAGVLKGMRQSGMGGYGELADADPDVLAEVWTFVPKDAREHIESLDQETVDKLAQLHMDTP